MFTGFNYAVQVPTAITPVVIDRAGALRDDIDTPVGAFWHSIDNTNGNIFPNVAGKTLVWIKNKNGGSSSITVTFVTQYTRDGLALADQSDTIPAGKECVYGPFTDAFNDTDKKVTVNFSGAGVADGVICVMKVGS